MENKFDDGYEIYGQETKPKSGYQPMSYEEAVEQRSRHKPIGNKLDYNFPMLQKAANIVKLTSAIFMVIFAVFTILAFATDGGVFFLDKTEATITDVNKHLITVKGENGDHQKTVYDMTLNYDYKDQNITMYARSEYPQFTNGTVYIYVSKFNSYSGWYIDGFGMIIKIVAIGIGITAGLLVASAAFESYGREKLMMDYDPQYGKSKFYPQARRRHGIFEDDLFNDRW